MSCSVCGSNVPCGCNCGPNLIQDPAMCCNTQRSSGCCQNVVAPTPIPFYQCAPACPEQHIQRVTIQSFAADVKIVDSWNVPACDMSAVVTAESLRAIVVGSYLWNPQYGYFEITAFNSGTGQITLLNHCTTGNAAEGTQIPACTEFTVTVPPCDCANEQQVCVAIDFTAPDVGDCIDITLTSTTGIQTSFIVQIGTGFYRVSAIKPNDIITICNDGDGITPGTPVIAGTPPNYNYCLQIISSNPCDADVVGNGNVLVCNSLGETHPINSQSKGWVLTAVDNTLENAEYRPAGSNLCTTLGSTLNIINGTASYSLVVISSAGFANGDIVQINNRLDRLVVTGVPDGTHINGDITPVPSVDATVTAGNYVCLASCCEQIQAEIDDIFCDDFQYKDAMFGGVSADLGAADLVVGTEVFTSTTFTVPMINNSTCRTMKVGVVVAGLYMAEAIGAATAPSDVQFDLLLSTGADPLVPVKSITRNYSLTGDIPQRMDQEINLASTIIPSGAILTIPAATTVNLKVALQATLFPSGAGSEFNILSSGVSVLVTGLN